MKEVEKWPSVVVRLIQCRFIHTNQDYRCYQARKGLGMKEEILEVSKEQFLDLVQAAGHTYLNTDIMVKTAITTGTYRNSTEPTELRTVKSAIENQRTIIMSEDLTTKISSFHRGYRQERFPHFLSGPVCISGRRSLMKQLRISMMPWKLQDNEEEKKLESVISSLVWYFTDKKKYTEAMKEIESAIDYNCK